MANTDYTYNQIVQVLEDFATNHKQISSFKYGEIYEMTNSNSTLYPAMWVNPTPSLVQGSLLTLKFNVLFPDIAAQDLSDTRKIQSDRFSVAIDFVTYMKNISINNIDIDETSIVVIPFTEKSVDNLAGWTIQIAIEISNYSDVCSIPLITAI